MKRSLCIGSEGVIEELWSGFLDLFDKGFDGSVKRELECKAVDDRSGIHSCVHMHNGDSCMRLLIKENGLERACATVLRKERTMHVDRSKSWELKKAHRHDFPISNNYQEIR